MLKYVLKRLAYMSATLWVVITITFFLMHAIPGDPLSSLARELPAQTKANYYAKYGLDKSLGEQYAIYMNNLLQGDLGESLKYPGRKVSGEIIKYAPVTARLGLQAVAIGFVLGGLLGMAAALRRGRWPDFAITSATLLGLSVPSFVLAALLQYVFAVRNSWLPATGWGGFSFTVLPTIALSTSVLAVFTRIARASSLDVLEQDYITAARAKGAGGASFVWKHVARNAVLPSVTLLGPQIAGVLTGSFVIENMFAIPGIGSNFVTSVFNRDYTMIMGMTVFYAVVYMAALLLVDIAYAAIDPRIRLGSRN